jgi:hypothetical protein
MSRAMKIREQIKVGNLKFLIFNLNKLSSWHFSSHLGWKSWTNSNEWITRWSTARECQK